MTRNWHPVPLHNRDMVDLLPGTVLSGHFVLGGPVALAADGGGLWRASDVATGQAVLVKILTARPAGDTVARARFRLAARALTGLSDPGMAPVRECGEFISPGGPACPYVIRDLVPGHALAERLLRGPLPADEALRVVLAVAEVLAAAHRTGLAHGNLGPGNIILGEHGVQVTDFGLSPLREERPGPDPYRAPELAAGAPFTPAADVYSLGVLLVACLSGMEAGPAGAAGAGQLVLSPGEAAESVPPALSALMGACLSTRPQDRPGAAHVAVMSRQARGGNVVAPGDQVVQFDADPAADTAPLPAWTAALDGSPGGPAAGRGVPGRPARLMPARRPGAGRFWPHAFAPGAATATVLVLVAGVLALGRLHMLGSTVIAAPPAATTAPASPAGPQPMATAAPVMALAAVQNLAQTVSRDVTNGMIRPDVGVDFGNFIRPVEADLVAGGPAGVRQLAATLRARLAQRVTEDAVTPEAARAIAAELNTMQAAPGT